MPGNGTLGRSGGEVLFASSVTGAICIPGLLLYLMYMRAVLNDRTLRSNSYYKLTLSLGSFDVIKLVVIVFYSLPCTVAQSRMGGYTFSVFMGWVLSIGWYSQYPNLLYLALNRYYALVRGKQSYEATFRAPVVHALMLSSFVFGFCFCFVSFPAFSCCSIVFYPHIFSWMYIPTPGGAAIGKADMLLTAVVVGVVLLINARVFVHMRSQHKQVAGTFRDQQAALKRRKREQRMFVQFFIIILFLLAYDFGFYIFPVIVPLEWLGFFISTGMAINYSCNPFVYMFLSSKIKGKMLTISYTTTNQVVSVQPNTNK